jgi:hypothetical protein
MDKKTEAKAIRFFPGKLFLRAVFSVGFSLRKNIHQEKPMLQLRDEMRARRFSFRLIRIKSRFLYFCLETNSLDKSRNSQAIVC